MIKKTVHYIYSEETGETTRTTEIRIFGVLVITVEREMSISFDRKD